MKFGLTAYGNTYGFGLHPESGRPKIGAIPFIQIAEEYGFQGVEIPYDILQDSNLEEVAGYLKDRNLFATIAASGYNSGTLNEALVAGQTIGASTVRTVVGGADFGGDRRRMKGKWREFVRTVVSHLSEAAETAERTGVNLAVENHQDLASEELIELCETIGSERFGITLDAANPLATAEEPIGFYHRVAPYVKNVHLKDYWIFWSEEGYRLVRCPVGQGVIDFAQLLRIFAKVNPDVTMSIEHGALSARHVRVLCEDYWTEYPPRSAQQLARLMRFVHDHARSTGDWRTPYERGESAEHIIDYEWKELSASTAYLKVLMSRYSSH